MQTLQVPAQTYVVYRTETTLSVVNDIAAREVSPLYEAVQQAQLPIAGPLEFIYWNVGEDTEAPFTLEIALPVATDQTALGKYEIEQKASFQALSHTHQGDFSQAYELYARLFNDLFAQGHQPTNQVREVYHKWVDLTSEENVIEILLGINA